MSLEVAIQNLRRAVGSHPEGLAAQQRHQAVTVPAAHAAAEAAVADAFGEDERTLLRDVLAALDGQPAEEAAR